MVAVKGLSPVEGYHQLHMYKWYPGAGIYWTLASVQHAYHYILFTLMLLLIVCTKFSDFSDQSRYR